MLILSSFGKPLNRLELKQVRGGNFISPAGVEFGEGCSFFWRL